MFCLLRRGIDTLVTFRNSLLNSMASSVYKQLADMNPVMWPTGKEVKWRPGFIRRRSAVHSLGFERLELVGIFYFLLFS
jgi:hypothetical protein